MCSEVHFYRLFQVSVHQSEPLMRIGTVSRITFDFTAEARSDGGCTFEKQFSVTEWLRGEFDS
jgi:hypothetical protein